MQVQFFASPQTLALAEAAARESAETLRVFSLKVKDDDYFATLMGAVNKELSPFKDEEQRDSAFMREMLDHYRRVEDFKMATSDRQIERDDTTVHAYLKTMEVGGKHKDAKTLQAVQQGQAAKDDERVREYLIRRL